MTGKSNYLENITLDWLTAGTRYVGLFNGDPTDAASGGTEVTTSIRGAGRVAVAWGAIVSTLGPNTRANSADVDFGPADGGTTMSHFGVFDAPSAGNMGYAAGLTGGSQSVSASTQVKFVAGSLVITED